MSNEQKDQMPELPDIDAALDDADEIVDLLEVVKPGKDAGTKDSASKDIDFSADLDAMLEKLESAERALDEQDAAEPFPDPTPVDHAVDPDETLDMPSMDDLNNLLETLGATADAPEAKDAAGGMPNLSADLDAAPIMKQSRQASSQATVPAPAGAAAADLPELADLGDLLAAADTADGMAPAAQEAAPAAKAPAVDAADLDALLAQAKTAVPKSEPVAAPGTVEDIPEVPMDLDDLPIAVAPSLQKPAPMVDGQPDLDALLAAADDGDVPGSKAPVAPTPKKAPAVARLPDLDVAAAIAEPADADPEPAPDGAVPETAAIPEAMEAAIAAPLEGQPAQSGDPKALPAAKAGAVGEPSLPAEDFPAPAAPVRPTDAEMLAAVAEAAEELPVDTGQAQPSTAPRYDEVDLNELDALLDDMLASAPAPGPSPMAVPAVPAQAAVSAVAQQGQGGLAPLQEAVIRMENSLQGLQAELKDKDSLIEAQQAQIASMQDTLEHILGNMDKLAAEAAAKVIREELAALLREEA